VQRNTKRILIDPAIFSPRQSPDETLEPERHPYLEVRVLLEQPEPGLRQRIDEALEGRPVRLLKVTTSYTGSGSALAETDSSRQLESLSPDEVFTKRYAQLHEGEPPPELTGAFHSLVESVMEVE
jgi:exonuclease SbcD